MAVAALGYLIFIHKLEYFLNARIVGGQISAKSWELLLAMLVFEAAFGLPGVVAGPRGVSVATTSATTVAAPHSVMPSGRAAISDRSRMRWWRCATRLARARNSTCVVRMSAFAWPPRNGRVACATPYQSGRSCR